MRGLSFGTDAERYDAFRPGYPPGLVDEVAIDGPGTALDVACEACRREDELTLLLRDVYAEVGGGAIREPMLPGDAPDVRGDLAVDGRFGAVTTSALEWTRRYSTEEWVAAAATFGDVVTLAEPERSRLLAAVASTVGAHGGVRDAHLVTSLVTATRS